VGKEFSGQVGKEVSDGTRSFISPVPSILNEFDALRAEMAAHFEPKVQLAYDLIHVYDPSQEENNPPLRDKNGVMYVPQFPDRHPIVAATISGPATEKVEAIREAIKGNKAWINPQSGKISMQFVRGRNPLYCGSLSLITSDSFLHLVGINFKHWLQVCEATRLHIIYDGNEYQQSQQTFYATLQYFQNDFAGKRIDFEHKGIVEKGVLIDFVFRHRYISIADAKVHKAIHTYKRIVQSNETWQAQQKTVSDTGLSSSTPSQCSPSFISPSNSQGENSNY
jgi:hypothetical protein